MYFFHYSTLIDFRPIANGHQSVQCSMGHLLFWNDCPFSKVGNFSPLVDRKGKFNFARAFSIGFFHVLGNDTGAFEIMSNSLFSL
mmetsp:Transcript_12477/g.29764  ORF Transcript_12477/g.29764 Transcript_12477/m.29764 type:complete len:85 (-) Transcript_12477:154-408(-)